MSSFRFAVAVSWAVWVLALAQVGSVYGQLRAEFPRRPAPAMVDASGTIEEMARGLIRIKSVAGQPWILQVTPETKVQVTGMAKKDVLSAGSFISFVAEVDKRRSEVQDKIGKLTLFTFSPERPLGAFPGLRGLGDAAGADAFGAEDAKPNPRSAQHPRKGQDTGPPVDTFEIFGRISGIDKTGKLTVYAPNPYFKPAVEIELTEDPEIELDLSGPATYTLARPGDKVQARGRQVAENVAQVMDLTIQLVEPFTTVQAEEAKKKPPRRTTRPPRRKRGEPEEPAEVPEEPAKVEPEPAEDEAENEKPPGDEKPKGDAALFFVKQQGRSWPA